MRNVRLCVSVRNPRTFLNENHSLIHRGGREKEGEKDEEGKREEEIMKSIYQMWNLICRVCHNC